jgi:hypothetical protein
MTLFRLGAPIGVALTLAACAQVPVPELRSKLAQNSVKVNVENAQNSVHVVTRTEAAAKELPAAGGIVGGLAIGLAAGAVVKANAEPEIPMKTSLASDVADILAKKFKRDVPQPSDSYSINISGPMNLVHPVGTSDDFHLKSGLFMYVTASPSGLTLLSKPCDEEDQLNMPLEKWRQSPALIESLRVKLASDCAAKFTSELGG